MTFPSLISTAVTLKVHMNQVTSWRLPRQGPANFYSLCLHYLPVTL